MKENLIRIAIADDHATLRHALMYSLAQHPSFKIIFDAVNGADLLNKLAHEQPDVLLLDIRMPNLSGVEALKVIHEKYPDIRTLMLTAFIDEVYVAQCLQYGINGYLTKDMDMEEIVAAIRTAYQNKVYNNNLLNNALFKSYLVKNGKNVSEMLPHFTEEEITILDLLRSEKTTEEISNIMHLSKRSIEIKRDKMREKANVKTVGGLLLYATKRNMLD
jgi:DNA-binding NarL/FixJ family response regulator